MIRDTHKEFSVPIHVRARLDWSNTYWQRCLAAEEPSGRVINQIASALYCSASSLIDDDPGRILAEPIPEALWSPPAEAAP